MVETSNKILKKMIAPVSNRSVDKWIVQTRPVFVKNYPKHKCMSMEIFTSMQHYLKSARTPLFCNSLTSDADDFTA